MIASENLMSFSVALMWSVPDLSGTLGAFLDRASVWLTLDRVFRTQTGFGSRKTERCCSSFLSLCAGGHLTPPASQPTSSVSSVLILAKSGLL